MKMFSELGAVVGDEEAGFSKVVDGGLNKSGCIELPRHFDEHFQDQQPP